MGVWRTFALGTSNAEHYMGMPLQARFMTITIGETQISTRTIYKPGNLLKEISELILILLPALGLSMTWAGCGI